jgi:hypothetical protein
MDANKLIGKTFAYKGIGNMVYSLSCKRWNQRAKSTTPIVTQANRPLFFPTGKV